MARHDTFKFWFGCILASAICIPILYFFPMWIWHQLGPTGFWQRLISFGVACFLTFFIAVGDIFLWIWIASRFE